MFGLEYHNHARESPFCTLTLIHMGDDMRGLYARLIEDGVDRYAWLDKEKLLPGQDWELEIRKGVRAVYF